jgi:transcriptional antiterminator RfaH
MTRWYALYTKAHRGQQVHDLLQDRGVSVFLPRVCVLKKRRIVQTNEPLFPCYLFARFDPHVTGLYPVQWTQGLRSVVSFCALPVIMEQR